MLKKRKEQKQKLKKIGKRMKSMRLKTLCFDNDYFSCSRYHLFLKSI